MSEHIRDELRLAIERARHNQAAHAVKQTLRYDREQQQAREKAEQEKKLVGHIRGLALETSGYLLAQGIRPNHSYTATAWAMHHGLFKSRREPVYTTHEVWTMHYEVGQAMDTNPTNSSRPWRLERFIGVDRNGDIHCGLRGNDQQSYVVLGDNALLYGPDHAGRAQLKPDQLWMYHGYVPLAPEVLIPAWTDCFASGIARLTTGK
jgi:Arc/MetJ-type ribon-helix-helix transcriptional regulator